ncbi:MAG: hypothetical protein ACLULH_07910 [Bacteroides fragilis]
MKVGSPVPKFRVNGMGKTVFKATPGLPSVVKVDEARQFCSKQRPVIDDVNQLRFRPACM